METFTLIPSEKKVNQTVVYECENFPDDAINRDFSWSDEKLALVQQPAATANLLPRHFNIHLPP